MYLALKHSHMLLAILSISLFALRFIWRLQNSCLLKRRWARILPHAIDTLLLISAVTLLLQVPWYLQPWLWEKLVLITGYIGLGFVVMKFASSRRAQIGAFVAAMACVLGVVYLAHYKVPFLLG